MNSTSSEENSSCNTCANCGKEGSDVTNTCNKCKSVMYCNAACKKRHRHKHKKECERRVAELHDEKLFKQPPPNEDCPICFLRMPILESGRVYMNCCGKVICTGCVHAFRSRVTKEEHDVCPFCRSPPPYSDGEMIKRYEKRIYLNDAEAIYNLGCFYSRGTEGLLQNHEKALELWHRAAELGSAEAYYSIGNAYLRGNGVDIDMMKVIHYWDLAAMGGDVDARHNLGVFELQKGNKDRALKHYTIAVKDGDSDSLKLVGKMCKNGNSTKDDYTKALRLYQAYLEEIKSDQRDEAAAFRDEYKYYKSVF